jgi:hypothetical protein
MARSILKRLIREDKARLYRLSEAGKGEEELPLANALEVLDIDTNWRTPDLVGIEFRYANTEKGDRTINKIWAEASS